MHYTKRERAVQALFWFLFLFCCTTIDAGLVFAQGASGTNASTLTDRPDRPVQVMVELETPPAAHVYAAQRELTAADADAVAAATRARLATIAVEQDRMAEQLARLDVQEVYRLQRVYNGMAVLASPATLEAIASLPGVLAVHPMVPKTPDHQRSVPYMAAPQIWDELTGMSATGDGIVVAVIDTGIDYRHAMFGGSQDVAIHNDPTRIDDVADFPSVKVVAGYDFAGDGYNADPDSPSYNPFPLADPDPMDCSGHGTHVAGTVAGQGVVDDPLPRPYVGPYAADTFDRAFQIGPGVAPAATLAALKIFGCQGSSGLTELAIEWAVDPDKDGDFSDRVDVINMSLGSKYGSRYDSAATASENAALIGVVVVASAGNSGDVHYVVGSPATGTRVISVAAARDHLATDRWVAGADVWAAAAGFSSLGPRRNDHGLKPDIAAPGVSIQSAGLATTGAESRVLSGTSMAAPHVAGAMALLRQIYPDWRAEELKALVMNTARLHAQAQIEADSVARVGSGMLDLAAALNTQVIAYNGEEPGAVSISFGAPAVQGVHVAVKTLQVRNKRAYDVEYLLEYRSDTATPGVDIAPESARVRVPANSVVNVPIRMTANGTEMRHTRSPGVAQSANQPRHWLTEEMGNLLLWPADEAFEVRLGPDVQDATAGATVYGSFDYAPPTGVLTYRLDLDQGSSAQIGVIELRRGLPGQDGGLISALPLPTGSGAASSPITGTLTLAPADVAYLASGSVYLQMTSTAPNSETLRGQLSARTGVLHVPIYAAPRPAADMRAARSQLTVTAGEPAPVSLELSGDGLAATEPPLEYASLVSAFELTHSSLNERRYGNDHGSTDISDQADLRAVGIAVGPPAPSGKAADRMIYFGLSAYADWSTPNEVVFNIYVDADEDGSPDYRFANGDVYGHISKRMASDIFVVVVERLATGEETGRQPLNLRSPLRVDTALFNTNVMILPVRAGDIGLSAGNTDFVYQIETFSADSFSSIDVTPLLVYDIERPAIVPLWAEDASPFFADATGGTVDLRIDLVAQLATGGRDLLLFHHQNRPDSRVEIVDVEIEWPVTVYLPLAP